MADMLVIVPTRGRPDAVPSLFEAWQETSSAEHADLLFAVDDDDETLPSYLSVAAAMRGYPGLRWRVGPRRRLSGTLNAAAVEHAGHYRYLAFMGDDHRPRTVGWAAQFVERLSTGTGLVYGNDLLRGEALPTAVAMTSDIVTALGYFCPPELRHLYLDDFWRDLGVALGRLTYLPDVIVEHMHPAAGKAENDAGYDEVNAPEVYAADGAAYQTYLSGRFTADIAKLRAVRVGAAR